MYVDSARCSHKLKIQRHLDDTATKIEQQQQKMET